MADTSTTLSIKDGGGSSKAVIANQDGSGNLVPHHVLRVQGAELSVANPVPTSDANGAAFLGVVAITPGTPFIAGRSIGFVITNAGNVTFTFSDSSTLTVAMAVNTSLQTYPFAATNIALGSGTAGSFWNFK